MAWFKKKIDPISDRSRALNEEIAALEAEIKTLDSRLQRQQAQPKLRSTALPYQVTVSNGAPAQSIQPDPIFEEVNPGRLKGRNDAPTTPEHYNELGVRKYDLPALLHRVRNHFRGPSTTNPKLVSYLAAGGIQGLRPLRYEKRVARNRFFALVTVLFVLLLGLIAVFFHRR